MWDRVCIGHLKLYAKGEAVDVPRYNWIALTPISNGGGQDREMLKGDRRRVCTCRRWSLQPVLRSCAPEVPEGGLALAP